MINFLFLLSFFPCLIIFQDIEISWHFIPKYSSMYLQDIRNSPIQLWHHCDAEEEVPIFRWGRMLRAVWGLGRWFTFPSSCRCWVKELKFRSANSLNAKLRGWGWCLERRWADCRHQVAPAFGVFLIPFHTHQCHSKCRECLGSCSQWSLGDIAGHGLLQSWNS